MGAAEKAARRKAVVDAARHDRAREQNVDRVIWAGGIGGVAAVVLALVYLLSENWAKAQSIEYLDATPTEDLQQIFLGGLPWLVLCSDSRKALKDGQLREPLVQAAARLADEVDVRTGVLDCSRELPSGKSVYERLALNTTRAPVLFLAQGGDRPLQLDPKLLKSTTPNQGAGGKRKMSKNSAPSGPAPQGLALSKTVKDKVSKRFRLARITTSDALASHCLKRRQCALFLGNGDPLPDTKALVRSLRREFPLMRWAFIDRLKHSLSAEKQSLEAHNVPRKRQQLVFFKHGAFRAMAPADSTAIAEWEARDFLRGLGDDENAHQLHDPLPSVKVARKSSAPPQRDKRKRRKQSPAAEDTGDDAQREAARRHREQERRREMEEAAQDFEPVYLDEEEEEEEDAEEEEEEDELVL